MYKFQFRFINTGEITDSDYMYKMPHTAKRGALAFLSEQLERSYHSPTEMGECRIFKEGTSEPEIYFGSKPMELQTLALWLQGYKAYKEGKFR